MSRYHHLQLRRKNQEPPHPGSHDGYMMIHATHTRRSSMYDGSENDSSAQVMLQASHECGLGSVNHTRILRRSSTAFTPLNKMICTTWRWRTKTSFPSPHPPHQSAYTQSKTRLANSKETLVMAIKPGAIPEKPGILSRRCHQVRLKCVPGSGVAIVGRTPASTSRRSLYKYCLQILRFGT